MMVEAEPSGDDNQPGAKAAAAVCSESAKPAVVVLLQGLEHERIPVHGGIVVAAQGPCNVQQQPAVQLEKCGPGLLTPRRISCGQQQLELAGQEPGRWDIDLRRLVGMRV
jgi:hypothetical protein